MRTFIAVEVPKEVQEKVGLYINGLKELVKGVKWVLSNNLHFTIKFLGEIEESKLKEIQRCVSEAVADIRLFTISLSGMGFYPSEKNPKVIWIGTDGGVDNMIDIFQHLEESLEQQGFDREAKTFSPHLTIGRVKRFSKVKVPEGLPEFETIQFEVAGLAVMKSTLTPAGPIYEKMFERHLKQFE